MMDRQKSIRASWMDIRANRLWAVVPLLALLWHGWFTITQLHPDYLLFVCYAANLMLGLGIITRSGLLTGTGFGWILIGFPLWLYDALLTGDWESSGLAFHLAGLVPGALSLRYHRYPAWTWVFALGLGLLLQIAAIFWTDPSLNVNAAFGVYAGWEGIFSSLWIYRAVMLVGFGLFFLALIGLNRRLFKLDPIGSTQNTERT